ncbi:unnamed protein product, partial [Owenia fusiformis]
MVEGQLQDQLSVFGNIEEAQKKQFDNIRETQQRQTHSRSRIAEQIEENRHMQQIREEQQQIREEKRQIRGEKKEYLLQAILERLQSNTKAASTETKSNGVLYAGKAIDNDLYVTPSGARRGAQWSPPLSMSRVQHNEECFTPELPTPERRPWKLERRDRFYTTPTHPPAGRDQRDPTGIHCKQEDVCASESKYATQEIVGPRKGHVQRNHESE